MATSQPPQPQVIYVQAPPPSGSSFGEKAASGLAAGGRIYSVIGAVVGVIIMIIMIIIGATKLRDKHTASASMQVTAVTSCGQTVSADNQGNTSIGYSCAINVSFVAADGKTYTPPQTITVVSPAPLTVGSAVSLRYDPNNPDDVVQEAPPKTTGWMLIGGGVALGALTVGIAVLTFKSKGFAEFEGAAGLAHMFRR